MNANHARLAAASGAGAAGAALLMLSQRTPGTMTTVLLLAITARACGPAIALAGSSMVRTAAEEALARQAAFVPAWVAIAAAAGVRAGTTIIEDVAGVHAVAGVGLVRGPILTVAGMWACALAAAIAIGGSTLLSPAGHGAAAPAAAWRVGLAGALTQVGLAAALVAGPQIRDAADAVPWVVTAGGIGAWAWFGRGVSGLRVAPWAAGGLAFVGLALVIVGGRP